MSKETFVDRILESMANMHSHVDIVQEFGGWALVRTYEIDDELLPEYGVPREQVLLCAETLEKMRDAIIQQEGPEFLRSVQMSNAEPEQVLEPKLTATVSNGADIVSIRSNKDGEALTHEDYIQLQILEHQVRHYPETVTFNSPIVLDGHQTADMKSAVETQSREPLQHPPAPTKDEANKSRQDFQESHKLQPGRGRGLSR